MSLALVEEAPEENCEWEMRSRKTKNNSILLELRYRYSDLL